MRPLVPLIALALLAAGCVAPATSGEEPLAPASWDGQPAEPQPAGPDAPAEKESKGAADPAPPADPPVNDSAPAEPPVEPAPPAPVPWALAGNLTLGWFAGVGAGDALEAQGETDAEHCPEARLDVPGQSERLVARLSGAQADAESQSAGALRLRLIPPEGAQEPEGNATTPPEAPSGSDEAKVDAPAAGTWRIVAEPVGPVVSQSWNLTVEVSGVALAPPRTLLLEHACGA